MYICIYAYEYYAHTETHPKMHSTHSKEPYLHTKEPYKHS